jgi:hypothetical protein
VVGPIDLSLAAGANSTAVAHLDPAVLVARAVEWERGRMGERGARTGALALVVGVMVGCAVLAGCTSSEPEPGPAASTEAATTEAASACASSGGLASAPASTGDEDAAAEISAAALCAIDGLAWRESAFVMVTEIPDWDAPSDACDAARQAAYWDGWRSAQPAGRTLDLYTDESENADFVGSAGVTVIPTTDPSVPVGLFAAELDACLAEAPADGSTTANSRLEHGDWLGVLAVYPEGERDRTSWWLAVDDAWVHVQAYPSTDPPAGAVDFDAALAGLLDAQEGLLASD